MFRIIATAIAIFCTYLISEFVFTPMHLYSEIWWIDIPMHIWGGFLFSLLFIYIKKYFKKDYTLAQVLFFIIFVGVVWEIYEYSMYIMGIYKWGGVLDTLKDLVMDIVGGCLAYLLTNKNLKFKN